MHCKTLSKVSPSIKLCGAVDDGDTYDFCMCNPPFFGSNLEAWGMLTSRSDDRPEPKSVSTASPQESIVAGGEVEFVKQIILDSLKLRNRITIYTTMLGKKSSLAPLKAELHKHGIDRFGTTELCQGRTMRWALGWTFDENVVFKPPISKLSRQKPRPPLLIKLPCPCGAPDSKGERRLGHINNKVIQLLDQLQMTHKVSDPTATSRKWQVLAKHNTWSHQRRKRRQMAQLGGKEKLGKPDKQPHIVAVSDDRLGQDAIVSNDVGTHNGQVDVTTPDPKVCDSQGRLVTELTGSGDICTDEGVNGRVILHQGGTDDVGVTKKGGDSKGVGHKEGGEESEHLQRLGLVTEKGGESKGLGHKGQGEESEHLLRFALTVTQEKDSVVLQFTWVDGQSYDLLHQVVQFFRNRLQ